MADDAILAGGRNTVYPQSSGIKRTVGNDPRTVNRPSSGNSPGINLTSADRGRRSSNLSDYSINEARRQFHNSTEDILLSNITGEGHDGGRVPSHWHSAPLALALLPAIGGMLFKNGSSVVTDATILALAAIFLNWSVRVPWDWYHSAQEIRIREEDIEQVDDNLLSSSQVLEDVAEEENEQDNKVPESKGISSSLAARESATNELYVHELLALAACFAFPVLGTWLLHGVRSALTRPSEGLVSNFNLTIFLFASEIRPFRHLVKLIQARTLRLQKIVNAHAYDTSSNQSIEQISNLKSRLEDLEATRSSISDQGAGGVSAEPQLSGKQINTMSVEVRRTLQPELDSLNRAVRRYEKRLATQTMQTEARILDLEARLADAITLAAAAAQHSTRPRHGLGSTVLEWATFAAVFPLQLATLPFRLLNSFMVFVKHAVFGLPAAYPKKKMATNGRHVTYNRTGSERLQTKSIKR